MRSTRAIASLRRTVGVAGISGLPAPTSPPESAWAVPSGKATGVTAIASPPRRPRASQRLQSRTGAPARAGALQPASVIGVIVLATPPADAAPEAIEGDAALLRRIEAMRLEAGRRMGLGDVAGSVVPKPALLGPGEGGATLTARYLTPHAVHRAMAVTGGITLAVAARMAGTVAADLATPGEAVRIAHPAGVLEIGLGIEDGVVRWASVLRTARRIFEGNLLVPEPEGEAAFLMAAE